MSFSATKLRQNLYFILDGVLKTGVPVEVERNGQMFVIQPKKPVGKWDRLESHDVQKGDPEELVHLDWSREWNGRDVS